MTLPNPPLGSNGSHLPSPDILLLYAYLNVVGRTVISAEEFDALWMRVVGIRDDS